MNAFPMEQFERPTMLPKIKREFMRHSDWYTQDGYFVTQRQFEMIKEALEESNSYFLDTLGRNPLLTVENALFLFTKRKGDRR